ncbi:MAG: SIS domain-containing protein [Deltaproteobacteria bacterium]|nr:SIS domain-containing protein [Deltaproteobacteria bacterium]
MSSKVAIEEHIKESARVKLSLLDHVGSINRAVEILVNTVRDGGRVYSCGNGGSACDAMHLSEELVARYKMHRPGIPAHHLCDAGVITCWANDYSFNEIFERQVATFVTSKDALVAFSTSGNSINIVKAVEKAKEIGAVSIALLGKGGGKARDIANLSVVVQSDITAHIQEAHIAIVHIICEQLEMKLFSTGGKVSSSLS